jgi:hypothetical protein
VDDNLDVLFAMMVNGISGSYVLWKQSGRETPEAFGEASNTRQ